MLLRMKYSNHASGKTEIFSLTIISSFLVSSRLPIKSSRLFQRLSLIILYTPYQVKLVVSYLLRTIIVIRNILKVY